MVRPDQTLSSGLAIAGAFEGTHVGASLERAAVRRQIAVTRFDTQDAMRTNRVPRAVLWRFGGHRPARLHAFSAELVSRCVRVRPALLIATGAAPLTRTALRRLRGLGVACFNYSTDDPWNKAMRRPGTRGLCRNPTPYSQLGRPISNVSRSIGCADVHYLPFAYDDELFSSPGEPHIPPSHDILFVGGADKDRIAFITRLLESWSFDRAGRWLLGAVQDNPALCARIAASPRCCHV